MRLQQQKYTIAEQHCNTLLQKIVNWNTYARTHIYSCINCVVIPVSAVVLVVEVVRNFMKSCQTRQRSNRHTNSPNDVQSLYSLNLYAYAEENTFIILCTNSTCIRRDMCIGIHIYILVSKHVPVGVGAVNDDAATTAVVSVIISFDTYCVCCYCHGRKIAQ
uniref:Uncharacterized protein n=1 Tax=Glossina morsitans morsitans TaxID=37546 RepID=A0A1B0F9S7_GLOMM